jgi:DNA-binding NtrC family response regulator
MTKKNTVVSDASKFSQSSGRILLIDDDRSSIYLMSKILIDTGFAEPLTATSGKQARKMMKKDPCLVIFDVDLPDISGLQLLSEFRKNGLQFTAIIVSGNDDFKLVLNALENDAFWYLKKPLHKCEFLEVIRRAIILSDLTRKNQLFHRALVASMQQQYIVQTNSADSDLANIKASSFHGLSLAEIEQKAIIETLICCAGNKAKAARKLGISEKSIYNKMKKFKLAIPAISSVGDIANQGSNSEKINALDPIVTLTAIATPSAESELSYITSGIKKH